MFPTIFGQLHEQRPDAVIACFHDWDGFGRLFERQAVNKLEDSDGPTNAALHAVQFIREQKPALTFIHFDHVDHAGHHSGHGTPEYYAAVDVADSLIGRLLDGIKEAGIAQSTIVLVTADHGGRGKSHGEPTMAEIEIPWILYGPGVKKGHELTSPVNTYDTALTVAYILGIKPHAAWIGKPILDAFEK